MAENMSPERSERSIQNEESSAEQLPIDTPEKKYLLILLPVHYKERLDKTFPQIPFPFGIGSIEYDQGKLLRPVFKAWSRFVIGREPIVINTNYSDEPTTLKSTGEEIDNALAEIPEDADIAGFFPSAGGALGFVSTIDRDRLSSDEEVAMDELFEESRIKRAVIACSRVRVGDPSYFEDYEKSHPLYVESVEEMDKIAKRFDDMVKLGILKPEESEMWLGFIAGGDPHVPEGTGIDTIPVPIVVSTVEGHGSGIFQGAMMRSKEVRDYLRGKTSAEQEN